MAPDDDRPDLRPAIRDGRLDAGRSSRGAILEPVGTHAEHRRRGYGTRANLGVMAALARAGASAVKVATPASNTGAVAAYESCGLRHVEWSTAMVRP